MPVHPMNYQLMTKAPPEVLVAATLCWEAAGGLAAGSLQSIRVNLSAGGFRALTVGDAEDVIAIACVIGNRAKRVTNQKEAFQRVCLSSAQRRNIVVHQFSCWNSFGSRKYPAIRWKVLNTVDVLVSYLQHPSVQSDLEPKLGLCLAVAEHLVAGHYNDITHGADHYHARRMSPYPRWARRLPRVFSSPHHFFYRGYWSDHDLRSLPVALASSPSRDEAPATSPTMAEPARERPRHRSSGGGFWGFFARLFGGGHANPPGEEVAQAHDDENLFV